MRIVDLEQKSEDWNLWRRSGIGSSDASVLVYGKHFGRSVLQLYKEKLGRLKGKTINPAMERGNRLEPEARRRYARLTGYPAEPLCCVHDTKDWLKASLDGWVGLGKGIVVEIKVPGIRWDGSSDHYTALAGQIPEKYLPQLDHALLVTGAEKGHYVSYNDEFPRAEQFIILEHIRDEERLKLLEEIETFFWEHVLSQKEPTDWQPISYLG